jgi:hypothetical protein
LDQNPDGVTVLGLEFGADERIAAIFVFRNPERLTHVPG